MARVPGRPTRVLVVEDDAEVVELVSELLVREGYAVAAARTGVAAVAALTASLEEAPQVVLLDLGLPLEDGVSVLTFLRRTIGSGLPVIVMTGRADPEAEAAVRELGITEYLRKPVSPQELLASISSALGQG